MQKIGIRPDFFLYTTLFILINELLHFAKLKDNIL